MYLHRKALVVIYGSNADDEKAEVKIKPTLNTPVRDWGLYKYHRWQNTIPDDHQTLIDLLIYQSQLVSEKDYLSRTLGLKQNAQYADQLCNQLR